VSPRPAKRTAPKRGARVTTAPRRTRSARSAEPEVSPASRPTGPDAFDRLWSPWRMPYIRKAAVPRGCLFCRVAEAKSDRSNLVLMRRGSALLMLNRFPYNPGHLMVAPLRHVASFRGLRAEERADLLELTALAESALEQDYHPDGMNVGANLGRVAGAGYPGHLHLHLVPRWTGDTNFMPTIGGTRVLPESLARTWARLQNALKHPRG
jgi:ATP adenylyltransferase